MIRSAPSLLAAFRLRVQHSGNQIAIWRKQSGKFSPVTWQQLAADAEQLTQLLQQQGVQAGQIIAHWGPNSYTWLVVDLALQQLAAVHVPLHATTPIAGLARMLQQSQAQALIASGPQIQPLASGLTDQALTVRLSLSAELDESSLVRFPFAPQPTWPGEPPATIIFTSGTSGEPLGVMLSSHNLLANAIATQLAFRAGMSEATAEELAAQRVRMNLLPLSHVYARTCDWYATIVEGSQLALAESRDTFLSDCEQIRPTFLNAVPQVYEKIRQMQLSKRGTKNSFSLREILGGRLKECCIGGATVPDELFDFYLSEGLPLLPGYGLTEAAPCVTVSGPLQFRRESVGKLVPGMNLRLAPDGEILVQGPCLTSGYFQAAGATAAALQGGWLRTGDLGELDADGFLYLKGRKKEILVTAGGKNVVPTWIESRILRDPLFQQVIIVGEGRSSLAALVYVNPSYSGECTFKKLNDQQQTDVLLERMAQQLTDHPPHEQIRRVALLPQPFSIEEGELTHKQTLRRDFISQKYAAMIAKLYE